MRIEVATPRSDSRKDKGDLLESIAAELLNIQGYSVATQVRRTATELDLLCRHTINNRQIYVECKAHREPLTANALKNLLGTVTFHDYSEGWLITAGPLGKDAKGFQDEWETKTQDQRQQLSIYTPQRAITALVSAGLIADPPLHPLPPSDAHVSLGDWVLLITPHGRFWAQPILISGAPEAVQVFAATDGALITDPVLLRRLAAVDSTLSNLDFEYRSVRLHPEVPARVTEDRQHDVIQVQHGESWSDYRPSRPQDFVGRKPAQDAILEFLNGVRSGTTNTRVFAVTGDSGMGKSSLIAKLRSRARNTRYRNRYFLYAVDVRAATRPSYVLSSLLSGLRQARTSGFIDFDPAVLEISDHAEPLSSPPVQEVLRTAREQRRVICLVFDQFEELYSKADLFPVFEEAQRLFLSAASAESNLVLGFAWRTDSTVHQDHPAYFMWHRLRDHRFEVPIGRFTHSEASKAITIFERELGQKLLPGMRRQIAENSQGYPWLLKKLCIHLYGQLQAGESQAKLLDTLDVETLFAEDLKALSPPELTHLKIIAAQAPADWHEVIESAGAETLKALQDKRLIVRSGDRINLYWDLFREYVLTEKAPSVPFTYVTVASVGTLLAIAEQLTHGEPRSFEELGQLVGIRATTAQNIVHDLVMFRVAQRSGSRAVLDPEISSVDSSAVLTRIRAVLKRHALYLALAAADEGDTVFGLGDLIDALRKSNPTARHGSDTWKMYAERMALWLCTAGLLRTTSTGWMVRDHGGPIAPAEHLRRGKRGRAHRKGFQGEAPPERVVGCLGWIRETSARTKAEVVETGYRNARAVLARFGLVQVGSDGARQLRQPEVVGQSQDVVWMAAWKDETLQQVIEWLREEPAITGSQVGERLAQLEEESWKPQSRTRIGNGLLRWARWMATGEPEGPASAFPSRVRGRAARDGSQGRLFAK